MNITLKTSTKPNFDSLKKLMQLTTFGKSNWGTRGGKSPMSGIRNGTP